MTRRQEQLNSQLMEVLSTVMQSELKDPRLQMLNVTRVRVNRDASHAMVYFVSQDDENDPNQAEQALNRAKGFLRGVLAETLDLRHTPDLSFRYDKAAEETERVMELFELLEQEREENSPNRDDENSNES